MPTNQFEFTPAPTWDVEWNRSRRSLKTEWF